MLYVWSGQFLVPDAVDSTSVNMFDSAAPGAQPHAWGCGVMQVLPFSTGRRSACGEIISGASLTQLEMRNNNTAVAYMAAVHVFCTWTRDTFHIPPSSMGGFLVSSYTWVKRARPYTATSTIYR